MNSIPLTISNTVEEEEERQECWHKKCCCMQFIVKGDALKAQMGSLSRVTPKFSHPEG
jgi:hypothetical protein